MWKRRRLERTAMDFLRKNIRKLLLLVPVFSISICWRSPSHSKPGRLMNSPLSLIRMKSTYWVNQWLNTMTFAGENERLKHSTQLRLDKFVCHVKVCVDVSQQNRTSSRYASLQYHATIRRLMTRFRSFQTKASWILALVTDNGS